EDAPRLAIGVEAAIDEVADAAPGLRAAPGIGLVDAAAGAAPRAAERVRPAGGVALLVFEEAREIAHDEVAEAEDERILAGIDELVDPAGLEAGGEMDVAVRGDDRALAALAVEPAAA